MSSDSEEDGEGTTENAQDRDQGAEENVVREEEDAFIHEQRVLTDSEDELPE